jgi:hypothetical protein
MNYFNIPQMLQSKSIRYNQSKLAVILNINRGTLRKYMNDSEGLEHVIVGVGNKFIFMSTTHGADKSTANKY